MSETPPNSTPGITLADIRKLVSDTVGDVMKNVTPSSGGSSTPASTSTTNTPETGRTVKEQVEAALAGITEKQKRDERDKTIDEQLKTLAERTAEKPPVERRRVHKFMGWGE